jgi:hypothetical protein
MELQISISDPQSCDIEMPLQAVYYPLGFPLEIATNSRAILEAAEESWGHFRRFFPVPPLQLRIEVSEGKGGECPLPGVSREHRGLLVGVVDVGNFYVTDLERGFALAWVTQAAVEHRADLRLYLLEVIAWELLCPFYLTPVHAACVALGDQGVLLCGDPGAGKSTLSYACARRQWTFVSDDYSFLVRGRQERFVIGNPYQIRFRDSTSEIFPELKQYPRKLHHGDMSIEIPTAALSGISTTLGCTIDHVVFLNRGVPGPPRLLPFPKDTALRWFEQVVTSGSKETRDAQRASLRNLLAAEVLELRYSNLDTAVRLLEALVRRGGRWAEKVAKFETQPNA